MSEFKSLYAQLSEERYDLKEKGMIPDWYTTGGWQLFKANYLHDATGVRDTFERIAKTAAKHMGEAAAEWECKFFNVLWDGHLAGSTPVLSNTGTNKGMPVSCSGGYVGDSIDNFYTSYHEAACLTKQGFGTSAYLGNVRPRGKSIAAGGNASGVSPVLNNFINVVRDVTQGTSRRGAWAGYVYACGGDFYEVADSLKHLPDDRNIGWIYTDAFIARLKAQEPEAVRRHQRVMVLRCLTGKGYLLFVDKANQLSPDCYKEHGLTVKASNLCTEIMLHSDENETFTCVLSSMNLSKYNEWKGTDAVFNSIVFLDCITSEFLELAKGKKGFDKAIRSTERGRPLGLGYLGFHTYLQQENIPFESLDAQFKNTEITKYIKGEAVRASQWLAETKGEPYYCKGTGQRNTHVLAIAPNTSSALLCGGVSQGREPVVANVYNQPTAGGEIYRVNPVFLALAKSRVGWTDKLADSIIEHVGSVQHLDWLTAHEKEVFKTAYEINQSVVVRLAGLAQPFICQGQSLNLFFAADAPQEYISRVTTEAILNKNIKSLYYQRNLAGVVGSTGECVACEG